MPRRSSGSTKPKVAKTSKSKAKAERKKRKPLALLSPIEETQDTPQAPPPLAKKPTDDTEQQPQDENLPPPPAKAETRRSRRAAASKAAKKISNYEDDDSTTEDDDSDESVPGQHSSRNATVAAVAKRRKDGTPNLNKKAKNKKVHPSPMSPLRVRKILKSPPTSSIKEMTAGMWEENTEDWRVSSAMDY